MKREGMRGGASSEGVAVPDWDASCGVEAGALRSDREDNIPESIPMPRVPECCQSRSTSGQEKGVYRSQEQ